MLRLSLVFSILGMTTPCWAQQAAVNMPQVQPPYSASKFPNWSGVWQKRNIDENGGNARTRFAAGTGGVGTTAPPPVPLKGEYAIRYKVLQDRVAKDLPIALPPTRCLPPGMPYMLFTSYPMEILMTPGQVTMIVEFLNEPRHIYMDGRKLPEDPDPLFAGSSVGHWEGDTLVVETIGIRDDTVLDSDAMPHSDALRVTERYRETRPGVLDVNVTLDDSKAFEKPFTRKAVWTRQPDGMLLEYFCENNRNPVDANGETLVVKPAR